MTRLFPPEYIEAELRNLDAKLSRKLTIYVIGGGAMAHHGIKAGTKDIDVIIDTTEEADELAAALRACGYKVPPNMTIVYQKMGARQVLENADEFRWDIFVRNVLGFHFSDRMAQRTQPWLDLAKMRVTILALEDIFTFKALTSRDRDRDDMNTIFLQGIDMDIVHDEVRQQAKDGNGKSFPAAFRLGIEEFVEKYRVVYEMPRDIEDLALHAMLVEVLTLMKSGEVVTVDALAKKLDVSVSEIDAAARECEASGKVRRDGASIGRL